MEKPNLIAVFWLIVFAGFTQTHTANAASRVAAKPENNQIELAKQKKDLEFQKQETIKSWRQLKEGMTQKQVRRILGKPKLIQGGSHECIWFYQDLPVSNAQTNFRFREGGKKQKVKNRYGEVIQRIGISSVGGVKHGLVFFEAKSLDTLIMEERAKSDRAIAKEQAKRDKDVASYRVPQIRNFGGPWHDPPDAAERRARGTDIIKKRCKVVVEKLEKGYNRRVKKLSDSPRSPILVLRFFNQPDWERFDDLLAGKELSRVSLEKPIDKWKAPLQWRKLKINMPPKKIHLLLGEPERSETNIEGKRTYYGDVPGHGKLSFRVASDFNEYLDSWIEPFWPVVEKSLHTDKKSHAKVEDE